MKEMQSLIKKIIVRLAMLPLVLFLLVIVPAGTFNFWEVYVYFGILLIPMIYILFFFLRNDPVFLERRTRLKEKEKEQKIILVVFNLVFIAGFVIPGLDKRFGWSDVPTGIVLITDLIIFLGYMLIFAVFRQNSHASRIVEVESGQKVITTGLYSIVRHPMYLGILIMYIPTPVALGSYWGLIPMSGIILGLILRIANEEKVLRQNLEGYIEYCQRTRYRLIPFLW
ncbi:MAG: isoprenylcysteine carboxylmethyltransferase family protein [Bacteroidetes bacterium]|nr:MAG: isoprenylcysteine carboxylmethyltransferase family protein [Bacteroidota bacterium]